MRRWSFSASLFVTACLLAAILIAAPTVAHAADAVINTEPILSEISGTIANILIGIGGLAISWAAYFYKRVTGKEMDAQTRAYLDEAMRNGINLAMHEIDNAALRLREISVKNQIVAMAATYVIARVPDALARFKIDRTTLSTLILARLPLPPAI